MFFAHTTTLLFSLLLLGRPVLGANELRIHNASELITFSDGVNSGANYSGTIIYLDSDIVFDSSLSQEFQPIGNESNCFQGTFDGQGHTISGLALNSSSENVGLFGYSNGAVVKNVVLDESCSFVSSSCSNDPNIGAITGYCESCVIESIVSLTSVAFTGGSSSSYLGGIIGRLIESGTIKNCVNYGPVTHSGTSAFGSYIGGIVGLSGGTSVKFIQNCANYGAITNNGTSSSLCIGGIIGDRWYGTIIVENCVSVGQIVNSKQASENYIGSVLGYIGSGAEKANITHCLWTSDVGNYNLYDTKSKGDVTVTNSSIKELNATTVNELNEYTERNSAFSNWFMLHLNGGRINNLNQETLIVTQKHFPDPVKERYTFLFWCKDAKCSERYDPQTTVITGVTDLYAAWTINNYTITFIFNNGTENVMRIFNFNETIVYPEDPTKKGHTFNGWSPRPERMPAMDVTVTAQWIEKPSEIIEIVITKKDLKEKEIKEIIKRYTDDKFTIEKIDDVGSAGETRVIVKFVDVEKAKSFVDTVKASSGTESPIKKVGFIHETVGSFSASCLPTLLFGLIM